MRALIQRDYSFVSGVVRFEVPAGYIASGEMARKAVEDGAATIIREPAETKPAGPTEAK